MLIPKHPRLRDRAYLDTARGRGCAVPGCWATTTIAAHIRTGNAGGTGLKPSDDEVEFMCHHHHTQQEEHPGPEWWMNNIGGGPRDVEPEIWMETYYRPKRKRAYQDWLRAGKPKYRNRMSSCWSSWRGCMPRRRGSKPASIT